MCVPAWKVMTVQNFALSGYLPLSAYFYYRPSSQAGSRLSHPFFFHSRIDLALFTTVLNGCLLLSH